MVAKTVDNQAAAPSKLKEVGEKYPSRHGAGELYGIQYLRALAAVGVLCFHVSEQFGGWFDVGQAGVDVFFIVSGFIMTITTLERPLTPATFMWRRLTRIVPLYWLATFATFGMVLWKPQFMFGHDASFANLLGSLVFVPAIQDELLHPVLLQGWTLCYEMMFYVIFAAAMWIGGRNHIRLAIGAILLLALIHPLLPSGHARIFTAPIILEFAGGMVIGWLWKSEWPVPRGVAVAAIGLGVLGFAAAALSGIEGSPVLISGIPAMLVVAGTAFAERGGSWRPLWLLKFLGEASYSIYVWHVLIAVAWTGILLKLNVPVALQPAAIVVLTTITASALYALVEQPIIGFFRRYPARRFGSGRHAAPAHLVRQAAARQFGGSK